jgi:mannosyltransferase OCH1-like enzyme
VLLKAIIIFEIPGRDIKPFFKNLSSLDSIQETQYNCFTTWKSNWLPKSHANDLKSFIQRNQEFNFYFFDDKEQEIWMNSNYFGTEIYRLYSHLKFPAARSDIFRYCVVKKYGGIFFSINRLTFLPLVEIAREFSDFRISFSKVPFVRSTDYFINEIDYSGLAVIQYTISAPRNHPIFDIVLQKFVERAPNYWNKRFEKVNRAIWELTGPYLLTEAIDTYLRSTINKPEILGFDFYDSLWIPKRSELRYFTSPSYTSFKNQIVIGE